MTHNAHRTRLVLSAVLTLVVFAGCGIEINFGTARARNCRIRGNTAAKNSGIQEFNFGALSLRVHGLRSGQ